MAREIRDLFKIRLDTYLDGVRTCLDESGHSTKCKFLN